MADEDTGANRRTKDGSPARASPIRGFAMEPLVILGLLALLPILAAMFGYDSRERMISAEETFAVHGFSWPGRRP